MEQQKLIEKMEKALEGKTIDDILKSDEWKQNISAYLNSQRADYNKAKEQAAKWREKGFKVKSIRHTLESLDFLTPENFADYYAECFAKASNLNHAQRLYITQLGRQVYNKSVIDITIKAFPELREEFYKPNKNN